MTVFYVVAEYRDEPSEGMQVVSKTLVDELRATGRSVTVIEPRDVWRSLPRLSLARRGVVVFTHGPGKGVVLATALLRRLTKMRLVWLATRPDVSAVPGLLRGRRTAHVIVGNRPRADLTSVAADHAFVHQFIGIDPARLHSAAPSRAASPWADLTDKQRPVLLHVGHLRPNRGLDLLVETKRLVGDEVEIVVQGSPTFEADPQVLADLEEVGIRVRRDFVPELAELYRACDLYVFPAKPEAEGAIELPLGVLEAVACGRPVLTNDFGAIRSALGDTPGVHITTPQEFAWRVKGLLGDRQALQVRPTSLPEHLHASRVTEAVLQASGELACV